MARYKCGDNPDHLIRVTCEERNKARWQIIQAANRFKMRFRLSGRINPIMLDMKDIQWAVFMARRYNLVKPQVMITAGYNPNRKRK